MSTSLAPTVTPPITLTTDFGTLDSYVAQMKGVILGMLPQAIIVDVTHEVPPQDIRRAAFLVAELAEAFPAGTVHVVVVDPGVGSDRSIIAVKSRDQYFVGPDNGVLTLILEQNATQVVTITNPRLRRPRVSTTFHGRDVMAPAAAHLVAGGALSELGEKPRQVPVRLAQMSTELVPEGVEGSIAWVDRFGNLVTTIRSEQLRKFSPNRLRLRTGSVELSGLSRFYSEVQVGEALMLIGSSGRLEIAVNSGSAAQRFGAKPGMRVVVDFIE